MENEPDFMDVFVSHSWGDKPIVEPIVAALQGAGIRCWYDLLELGPGDNLVDGINHGLTHCKMVLFCLSDNFLQGKWTAEELNAAVALARMQEPHIVRLVPLMLTDPSVIQRAYPIPFGNMVYIRWDESQLDELVDDIKKVLSQIDGVGKDHWYSEARTAYAAEDFVRAALYARKSVDSDPAFYPACVQYVAATLKLGRPGDAYTFIMDKEDDWLTMEHEGDMDLDVLDYVQDTITSLITGDEIKKTGFSFAIMGFLGTQANSDRAWRYLTRLYDKKEFEFHRDKIVFFAAIEGKEKAIDWLGEKPLMSRDKKVKEMLANVVYLMAAKLPEHRAAVLSIATALVDDESEDVRQNALPTYYRFADDGAARTVQALKDRAPMVRLFAFMLLAGLHNMQVDDDWTCDEEEPGAPDPLFGPEIVKQMLEDPEEMVVEAVMELIGDGKVACPPGLDLLDIAAPPSGEIRAAMVKTLTQTDTDASHEQLMECALNEPSEFARSEAIDGLKENSRPVPAAFLRKLYEAETVSDVKDEVESLIVEKGDQTLADIYFTIFERNVDSLFSGKEAFEKIVESGDVDRIKKAMELCSRSDKLEIAGSQLRGVLDAGLTKEAESVVGWCLDNENEESLAILAAGKLPGIPPERITRYQQHDNPILRADALRAIENRRHDGTGVQGLHELYEELKPVVLEKDNDACWASLEAIDGITEFEGADEAIEVLREYYDTLDKLIEGGSFPLRAAWERLRVLGVVIPHSVYDPQDRDTPYPWPSEDGPFYGIKREKG